MIEIGTVFLVEERTLNDMSGETGETFVANQIKRNILKYIDDNFHKLPFKLTEERDFNTGQLRFKAEIVIMTREEYRKLRRGE